MPSLNHVCVWSGNGWSPVTAEEAARMHPGGTVSAHSGLFMCELCGQYVLFTNGESQTRHFRHSSYEKSKNCPDRTFSNGSYYTYSAEEHPLPLRIVGITRNTFRFEIGLLKAPISHLPKDFQVEIIPSGHGDTSFLYLKERLNINGTTWLPVGDRPAAEYRLKTYRASDNLEKLWPSVISGIDPDGTLFEVESGKKVLYDADVELEKDYYLLLKGRYPIHHRDTGVEIQEIAGKTVQWSTWTLYRVRATKLCEEAARFFLDFHCRLTDQPTDFQPVWPLFVEGSYVIKHNEDKLVLLLRGNTNPPKSFPAAKIREISNIKLGTRTYEIDCGSRQQLISAGRVRAIQYTYYWKEPIGQETELSDVEVRDIRGKDIDAGVLSELPEKGILRFKVPYDGSLVISQNNTVFEKRRLQADTILEIDGIRFGTDVKCYVGHDCVWSATFEKRQAHATNNNSTALFQRLARSGGQRINAPHALRNINLAYRNEPEIYEWIRGCILKNEISKAAYRLLQRDYLARKKNGGNEG